MNRQVLAIVGVILALIASSTLYLLLTPREAATPIRENETADTSNTATKSTQSEKNESQLSSSPATYVNYTSTQFSEDTGTKLLFFHANWCPQCRTLDSDIQANLDQLEDITIYKVDYDTELDLRKKYSVTQQTTIIKTDGAGTELDSFVAYDNPSLASIRKNLDL